MMALAGVELETFVSEPDALTTRPQLKKKTSKQVQFNFTTDCQISSFLLFEFLYFLPWK